MTSLAPEDEINHLRRRVEELENELAARTRAQWADNEYRYSVELNPQVSWVANPNGDIEDFTQRWLDLTGLTRQQALGNGWTKVVHSDDLPGMEDAWLQSIRTGQPFDFEHRIRLREGGLRWMRTRAVPRRNPAGDVARWYGTTEDIHDRKEAELLLKNSQQMFSAAFAEAPIGMVLLTADGTILEVNQAYREMLGYSTEDIAGHNSSSITYPDDVEITSRFFENLQSGKFTKAAIEKRYFHRDGHIIWAKASATMRRDAAGRPMQVVAIVEDISARKLAEAERERLLRQVEAERKRLEAVAAQMPSGLVISDESGKLLFFNREVERILGHSLSPGINYLDYSRYGAVHPDGAPFRADEYPMARALLHGQIIHDEELSYRKGDGTFTTVQINAAPIFEGPGKIIGSVSIVNDIAPRKRMETMLRENEERLRLIFAQAPVGVCVLRGPDLVYELVNPHYQELLPGRTLVGFALLEAVPEVEPVIVDILQRVLNTGEPFAASEFLIRLDQDRDGIAEDCWFNFVYHPLRDQHGHVTGVVCIAVDVSSHVRARRELQRANRELEEFAYVSSHDLQEPLRAVRIYTQLLMRDLEPVLNDRTTGFAKEVEDGVERMEQLLRALLNFSRVIADEPGAGRPEGIADLNASVNQALLTLQGRIDETGATLAIGNLGAVYGDEAQLAQVFQNLVSNALKYRNDGAIPSIVIGSYRRGAECVVTVRDNGIGFPQNQAERIFGLFKRLHRSEYPGTGLGLAICKRIVERHGGRIWAESAPGEGATFCFSLRAR